MRPKAEVVEPPRDGLWRVGRSPDPLHYSDPLDPAMLDSRSAGRPPVPYFLDVEAAATRALLRGELGDLLAFYGYDDLDVPTIRGGDRRVTRWIGRWAHQQRGEQDQPLYAGIRYLSRLSSDWECWAIFEDLPLVEQERRPILRHDEALSHIAGLYGLTIF